MRRRFRPHVVGLALISSVVVLTAFAGLSAAREGRNGELISGIDKSGFDEKASPADDFFRYVNGAWLDKKEIPPDRTVAGSFVDLAELAETNLRAIAEEASAKSDDAPGSELRKIGDMYASFINEALVERLGLLPIAEDLDKVAAIQDKKGLAAALAEFERTGVAGAFDLRVAPDAKKSDEYIIHLSQSGLGLPDESYYRDPAFAKLRAAYVQHIENMFTLAERPEPKPAAEAVMALETKLAAKHWDRVKNRDRTLTYNKMDPQALAELAPGFDWIAWFRTAGADEVGAVIVREPSFFQGFSAILAEASLDDWKSWLSWRVLRTYAPYLNRAMVDESFSFYGGMLTGQPQNRPRWKRAVQFVEAGMGEAIGRIYVERHFPPAAKERMRKLVANLIEEYRADIESLDWMTPATRKKALEKLTKFTAKIGYPDKWRDYTKLEIRKGDLVGNLKRSRAFETARMLNKLGKPVDKSEWMMTPQTVNAYYSPNMNEIVFPAAILQPPFFNLEADDAVNYGAIGAVIGHEIGHGFDDQGSKSDGDGNLVDWWTDADRKEFEKRTKALIDQYSAFEPAQIKGRKVNGALTIGENIGDLGGLSVAYKAYKRSLGDAEAPKIDGLTGPQRFFIGWAQAWRIKIRDKELERRLTIDPHSPAEFRCNGVVRNMPEFYDQFQVGPGSRMFLAPEQRVRIW